MSKVKSNQIVLLIAQTVFSLISMQLRLLTCHSILKIIETFTNFFFLTWNRHFWVQGSIGGEKLAKLWSSNSETICFPHLLLTAKFTTLTCVLVHSISGKGPSWRPLPVGFSSSWPFWKYIETSTQNTFQTQIFYCLCIWCLVVWVCFPGCFLGKWAHLFPWSCKLVLIHAELPGGFITKNKFALYDIVLKMCMHVIHYKYLWLAIYHWRKNKQVMYILQELTLYYCI